MVAFREQLTVFEKSLWFIAILGENQSKIAIANSDAQRRQRAAEAQESPLVVVPQGTKGPGEAPRK